MIIEIHAHTQEHSPCSHIKASDLVRSIFDKGIGGIVLTDHHFLWTDDELSNLRINADIPEDFLVLAGQEVFTKDFGDVLVYGADESISQSTGLTAIRRKYPDAALIWAHPYRSGLIPVMTELFDSCFDAIEILNPRQKEWENERGISDWKTWGFTATSGTDIHDDDFTELYPIHLKEDVKDIKGFASCIKRGLCFPVMGKYMH